MVNFCSKCGAKFEDENSKFCSKCGQPVIDVESGENTSTNPATIKCLYCGNDIPIGADKCLRCGKYINPKANDNHKGAIIVGYIFLFIPIFSFIPLIIGIYLLTRPNKGVHKHGVIMIILSILFSIFWIIFIAAMSRPRYYYYSRPYYYY